MFFFNPRILILASLTALAPFAIDTYLPAFEVMEDDLATNSNFIQQTLTFYLVPYTIMTIFMEPYLTRLEELRQLNMVCHYLFLVQLDVCMQPGRDALD